MSDGLVILIAAVGFFIGLGLRVTEKRLERLEEWRRDIDARLAQREGR